MLDRYQNKKILIAGFEVEGKATFEYLKKNGIIADVADILTEEKFFEVNPKAKDENILGIFCSNEGTVKGLLAATNDGADFATKYKGLVAVGFDAGAAQKAAVRNQYFLGSITQDPYMIGYLAVELAYKAYKGESVADVDTGAKFYDKDNMDDADIAGLIYD